MIRSRARKGRLGRLERGGWAISQEFCAHHRDFPRRVDPEPDLASFQAYDRDADVVADIELFQELSGQH